MPVPLPCKACKDNGRLAVVTAVRSGWTMLLARDTAEMAHDSRMAVMLLLPLRLPQGAGATVPCRACALITMWMCCFTAKDQMVSEHGAPRMGDMGNPGPPGPPSEATAFSALDSSMAPPGTAVWLFTYRLPDAAPPRRLSLNET